MTNEDGSARVPVDTLALSEALARLARSPFRSPRLKFAPPLERAWQEHHAKASIGLQRAAVLLALFFYTFYFGYASVVYQLKLDELMMMYFSVFACPGNTLLLLATFHPRGWKVTRQIATGGVFLHTIGMYLFYERAQQVGIRVPETMLVLQVVFNCFMLGLPVMSSALLSGMALCAAPLAVRGAAATPLDAATTMFFILASAGVSVIGAYLAERTQRTAFVRGLMLTIAAARDPLTGLLNHGAFRDQASASLRHARRVTAPVAVVLADVDHFKAYNDKYGHPAGDECLRRVAQVLNDTGRRSLDVAGRLGGEEFAVFLHGATLAQAQERAEQLRREVRTVLTPDGAPVSVSIGVAHSDDRATVSLADLIAGADRALYVAKRSGRDQVRVEPARPTGELAAA